MAALKQTDLNKFIQPNLSNGQIAESIKNYFDTTYNCKKFWVLVETEFCNNYSDGAPEICFSSHKITAEKHFIREESIKGKKIIIVNHLNDLIDMLI